MRVTFWLLTWFNVTLVCALPIIPGHDLPQHLAYARILATQRDPFIARMYTVDTADTYATLHRVVGALANATSIDVAIHLVYALYALSVPLAFAWLVRAVH